MADTLRHIGAQMANVMFNLEQRPGEALTGEVVATMGSLRKQWDAALASRPAEVDDVGLPPLPSPDVLNFGVRGYTAEQFRQGQRDAVAADRARMPDADEISDAITEAYNMACVHKDWEAKKYWRELGDKFSEWAAPSHTTNKEK